MSGVTNLGPVNVADIITWVSAIDFREWPQQSFSELKPAMVTDPEWHRFGSVTDSLVHDVMAMFYPGCMHRQRMLSVVMPGHSIHRHIDLQPSWWIARVHIPLTANDQSFFNSGAISYNMAPGNAYAIDTRIEHSVDNRGDVPRIHLMFDVHP